MILCKDLNSFPSSPACTSLFLGTRVFLIYVTTRASFKKKTLLKIETRTNCWKRTGWNNWLSRVTVHNPSRDVNAFLMAGIFGMCHGVSTNSSITELTFQYLFNAISILWLRLFDHRFLFLSRSFSLLCLLAALHLLYRL